MSGDVEKSATAFRTISEVADDLNVPQHVLRFWETKFSAVRPMKRGGNRRYYRPEDLHLLRVINRLLYTDGYTIRGVQKLLREQGPRQLIALHADAVIDTPSAGVEPVPEDASPQGSPSIFDPALDARPEATQVHFNPGPISPLTDKDSLMAELRRMRSAVAAALAAS